MSPDDKSDEKAPDQRAPDQSPENVPASTDQEVRAVGVRTGMFGAKGTGDTSGYGGLVQPVVYPGSAQRPFGGWFDAGGRRPRDRRPARQRGHPPR